MLTKKEVAPNKATSFYYVSTNVNYRHCEAEG
jgi:hypothetical protein